MECKCGNNLFHIHEIPCCSDCSENPAYERGGKGDTYWKSIYDQKEIDDKDLRREGVEVDGECKLGTAFGAGCYMFICPKCNWKTNLAVSDSCG